jgi:Tol biopolymer transport system component
VILRRHVPLALAGCLAACRQKPVLADAGTYDAFHAPEDVAIVGYDGDVMEPFLTRDGRNLLFNNRNEPPENTDLHWAKRVDDLTFQYLGEIPGVNTNALEGVPSMDRDGNLYFVSTRSYDKTWSTIYRARLGGTPELVEGVSRRTAGWVNFDAEISADGKTLYFVDGYFGSAGYPQKASIACAVVAGNGFRRRGDSARTFENVNGPGLQYAPNVSADELELFITRVTKMERSAQPGIYRSVRSAIDGTFTSPRRVSAIQGFAEGSTLSPDGRSLYYHARVGEKYRLRRVTR